MLDRFSAIVYNGDNFSDFLYAFPSEMESTLKGKNLLHVAENSFVLEYTLFHTVSIFPYRVGPFSEGENHF